MNKAALLFLALALVFSCKKENSKSCPDKPCDGLSEIEWGGKMYALVEIGCQCWFAENLRYTSTIPEIRDSVQWTQQKSAAWCYYNNDPANDSIYGKLYNWYAAITPGICPPQFEIPLYRDSEELMEYLGGQYEAGGKMKATNLWTQPNEGATNESGFTALPAGNRSITGFHTLGNRTFYWNRDITQPFEMGENFGLDYRDKYFYLAKSNKSGGVSCRCVKKREE